MKDSPENNLMYTNTGYSFDLTTISKNSILITSIKTKQLTINEILGTNVDYNDDIYVFDIIGKTQKSPKVSWKIYKSNKQIKELFAQLKKELQKKDSTDKYNINKCKLIQNYTNGEIFKNLEKITNFIINIFNSTNPNQPISLK